MRIVIIDEDQEKLKTMIEKSIGAKVTALKMLLNARFFHDITKISCCKPKILFFLTLIPLTGYFISISFT